LAEPLLLSTWHFGQIANRAGWPHLLAPDGSALDAVEQACRAVEEDPRVTSVGYRGLPDLKGQVSLDAAIMLSPNRCGAVAYVRRFVEVISIARRVMEQTPHVLLVGEGAEIFAQSQGFRPRSPRADERTAELALCEHHGAEDREAIHARDPRHPHVKDGETSPEAHSGLAADGGRDADSSHDTIGVIARDCRGTLAAGCSTSGLAGKMPGRVGDSPIVGHGLYVDPGVGAAVATGHGELMMAICGSFLAVEGMRRGLSPQEAIAEVLRRIAECIPDRGDRQAAFIALDKAGKWAAGAMRPGFQVAVRTPAGEQLVIPDLVFSDGSD